jgi:hypothetical protein
MAPANIIQWGYSQSSSRWSILAIAPSLVYLPFAFSRSVGMDRRAALRSETPNQPLRMVSGFRRMRFAISSTDFEFAASSSTRRSSAKDQPGGFRFPAIYAFPRLPKVRHFKCAWAACRASSPGTVCVCLPPCATSRPVSGLRSSLYPRASSRRPLGPLWL